MYKFFILWRREKSEVEAIAKCVLNHTGRQRLKNVLTLIVCNSHVSAHPISYTLHLAVYLLPGCLHQIQTAQSQGRTNNRPVYALKANLFPPPLASRVGKMFSSAFSRGLAYLVVSAPLGRPCPAPGLVNRQGVGAGMEFRAGPDEIMLPLRCKSIPEDQRSSR